MCLGIPGRVIEVRRGDAPGLVEGKVDFGGLLRNVNLSYTPEVEVGDYVLVHVGFALSTLDEEEAQETLRYLRELGELSELGPAAEGGP